MISGECGLDPEMWKLKWLGWWTAILLGGPIILDLWNDFQSGAIHSLRDLSDQSYRTEVGGLTIIAGLNAMYWVFCTVSHFERPFLVEIS
jgi:hypothetical protein